VASTRPDIEERDWHPGSFRVLVTLGESTTAGGWSSTTERCWASLLAALISDFQDERAKLVNSGIGFNVISSRVPSYPHSGKPAANERIQKHVAEYDPDLLVISYSLNDARGGSPGRVVPR
jgi:lysophospholipase L1-like esterase